MRGESRGHEEHRERHTLSPALARSHGDPSADPPTTRHRTPRRRRIVVESRDLAGRDAESRTLEREREAAVVRGDASRRRLGAAELRRGSVDRDVE